MANPEEEKLRLTRLYGNMSEGELRQIASDAAELTDLAHELLVQEIARRGLDIPLNDVIPREELDLREMVTIRQFRDLPEALLAKGRLDSAGIDCFLVDQNMVRMDWFISNLLGGIKLQVSKDNAEEALALLSEPMPESFEVDGLGSYEQPRCPNCGSFEITHQVGLDKRFALPALVVAGIPLPVPENYWRCQSCGKEWQDLNEETSAESPENPL